MTPQQETKLDQIYNALVSDKEMGRIGLIERVAIVEKKQKADDNMKMKVAGGMIVLSIVGGFVFSVIAWVMNKYL